MSFLSTNLDKVAAFCVGTAAVTFGALPDGGLEALVGGVGLIGFVMGRSLKFGPECVRVRGRIQAKALDSYRRAFSGSDGGASVAADLEAAAEVLQEILGQCVLDRRRLAAAAVTPTGFPGAAVDMVMAELGARRPDLFGAEQEGSLTSRFARDVVRMGFEAAMEDDAKYYRTLEPEIMLAMGQALGRIEATTQAIAREQRRQGEMLDAMHAMMRKLGGEDGEEIARMKRDLNLTRSEFRALLSDIVGQGVEAEDIPSALAAAKRYLEDSRAELARLRSLANGVPEIESSLAAARAALNDPDKIDLSAAQEAIAEAKAAYKRAVSARRKAEAVNIARLTESEAAIALARFDFLGAARLFEEAAAELPESEKVLAAELRARQARALQSHGERFAGLPSLQASIKAFEAVLTIQTREAMPLEWAATQNDLGIVRLRLGEHTGGEAGLRSLEAAVAACEAALAIRTREAMPALWAQTQNNLGNARLRLGERTEGEAGLRSLEAAVAAYEAALTIRTREAMPTLWALTQTNLGLVQGRLGEQAGGEVGKRSLKAAVAAYQAALTVQTRKAMPADWSLTQNNLGVTFLNLGEREGGEAGRASLEASLAACEAALTVRTHEAMPALWAQTLNNLGNTLTSLGELTADEAGLRNLKAAVAVFEAALTVRTREAMPALWAMTQSNLGNVLLSLGARTEGEPGLKSLKAALAAHEAALTVRTREAMPADWAMTQSNLGNVLTNLGQRTEGEVGLRSFKAALAAYEAALTVYTREAMPTAWAAVRKLMGTTLFGRASVLSEMAPPDETLAALDEIVEFTREVDDPQLQECGFMALLGSVEMTLLLGDPADAAARARRILDLVDASDQSFALMPFLIWLADPAEMTPEGVVAAIEGLAKGVKFAWSFQDIAPLVAELPPERERLAEGFIAHFEGRLDLAALKEVIGGPAPDSPAD